MIRVGIIFIADGGSHGYLTRSITRFGLGF